MPVVTPVIPETVTPAAAEFARSLGLHDSLLVARQLTRQMLPSMRALHIDVEHDPEEEGLTTICFHITMPETVERVVELNDALHDALFECLPARAGMYFSFAYRFD